MKFWRRLMLVTFIVGAAAGIAPKAHASQVDLLIEKLVEKKILTRFDAEAIRAEIETAEKKDFKAQMKQSSPWIDGLKSAGDVRVRYESFSRESEDSSDRNRFRFRVRWGLEKKFGDEWKAGFRLASGESANNPTSTNQSFDGEFGLKSVFFDRAYVAYSPTSAWKEKFEAVEDVQIAAGKVENPYDRDKWNSTIVWDGDVTPEGLYEKIDFRLATPSEEAKWDLNTLMGQWVVDEDSDLNPGDHEMYSYGIGTTYQWKKDHNISFKTTYYDWQDYAQFVKTSSIVTDSPGGNDREVSDFKILNFYSELNFDTQTPLWGVMPLKIFGDYAVNTGAQDDIGSTNETLQNPALRADSEDAFSIGATLGKTKDQGSWALTYEYLYIEPNAVVGNFAESDLGVGFANNKGHRLGYKYMVYPNVELGLTAWLVERVDNTKITYGAASIRPNGDDDQLLRTQVDLAYKF